MPLLQIEHSTQELAVGCLAACAQMALQALGVQISQRRLNRLLDTSSLGAPFSDLSVLTRLGVDVSVWSGSDRDIRDAIDREQPCIAAIRTGYLSYWSFDVQHAILIAGYSDHNVHLHDPAFVAAPMSIDWNEFMIAWIEADNLVAVLA